MRSQSVTYISYKVKVNDQDLLAIFFSVYRIEGLIINCFNENVLLIL